MPLTTVTAAATIVSPADAVFVAVNVAHFQVSLMLPLLPILIAAVATLYGLTNFTLLLISSNQLAYLLEIIFGYKLLPARSVVFAHLRNGAV